MKNAHLRFGRLSYTKVFKKSSTHFTVPLDRFIGETQVGSEMKAHLISVVAGDTQIAALGAALTSGDGFTVERPDGMSFHTYLGANAECYRGSLQLEGYKRPLRHLVAVSEELAQTGSGKLTDRTMLLHDSPGFVWTALAHIHGVPGAEDWALWLVDELKQKKAIQPLVGIGCTPVLVKASKGLLMNCIARGLRRGRLEFPERNGPLQWTGFSLAQLFLTEPLTSIFCR